MFWVLLSGAAVIYLLYSWLTMRPANFPPGPPYFPVIGSGPFLRRKNFHLLMEKWRYKYGPVVGIFLGRKPAIAVCDPATIIEVLRREEFQGRPDNVLLKERSFHKKLGLIFNEGPAWSEQRRFSLRHLKEFGFGKISMETMILDEIQVLMQDLEGKTSQVIGLFNLSTVNLLWGVMGGVRYDHNDPEFSDLRSKLAEVFRTGNPTGATFRAMFPFLRHIAPQLFEPKALNIFKELQDFIRKVIQQHMEVLDENEPRDFIDVYLTEMNQHKTENSSFTEEMLIVICMDLFTAGSESIGNTLSFAMLYMVLFPEIQEKVQQEIDSQIGQSRNPRLEDKSRLPYVEAVIMEIQRINTVSPFSIPHRATETAKLQGYIIPKGTTIILNIWSLLQDKGFWKDPTAFRPERFLDTSGKIIRPEWYLPFGLGKRVCLGEAFARNTLFLFFTSFLQKFTITIPPGHTKPSTSPRAGFNSAPEPFEVTFISR